MIDISCFIGAWQLQRFSRPCSFENTDTECRRRMFGKLTLNIAASFRSFSTEEISQIRNMKER